LLKSIVKEKKIGQGEFGDVFLGRWKEENNKKVALKLFKNDPKNIEPFISEVLAVQKFKHPFVVAVYGAAIIEGQFSLVLEFCENGSLLSWIQDSKKGRNASHFTFAKLIEGVLKSVVILEEKKALHRDIAARNFLLTEDLVVKLSDFGMAKQSEEVNFLSISISCYVIILSYFFSVLIRCQKYTVYTKRSKFRKNSNSMVCT
jgi:serine/threonine protein kinase